TGPNMLLTVILQPIAGRSPHYWFGPPAQDGRPFAFDVLLHRGMGPGGILWRPSGTQGWSSLDGASAWGIDRLNWPSHCTVGAKGLSDGAAFEGADLDLTLSWNGVAQTSD
ncbi:MAG: hypothetical protein AAF637_27055, partial [Pseudomonadota bacterium]